MVWERRDSTEKLPAGQNVLPNDLRTWSTKPGSSVISSMHFLRDISASSGYPLFSTTASIFLGKCSTVNPFRKRNLHRCKKIPRTSRRPHPVLEKQLPLLQTFWLSRPSSSRESGRDFAKSLESHPSIKCQLEYAKRIVVSRPGSGCHP